MVSGRLAKGDRVKLLRGEEDLGMGRIINPKCGKEDVAKVEQGEECGANLTSNLDFLNGDVVLSAKIKQVVFK